MLIKFNLEAVCALLQVACSPVGGGCLVVPGVDDQSAINPDPDAIVVANKEIIDAIFEIDIPGPAHGEVVGREAGWPAVAPVELEVRVGAGHSRRAG